MSFSLAKARDHECLCLSVCLPNSVGGVSFLALTGAVASERGLFHAIRRTFPLSRKLVERPFNLYCKDRNEAKYLTYELGNSLKGSK